MPERAYGDHFFDRIRDEGRPSAAAVASWLVRQAPPASVLDVGCAEGAWLAEFSVLGVSDVVGLDGSYVDRRRLLMPVDRFVPHDLSTPFDLKRQFDLLVCLEVAEHLDLAHADRFVASLARHADALLFSAAIPNQQGTDHRNEQWPGFWIDRFRRLGYDALDVVRPALWTNDSVAAWYRQNTILFVRGSDGYAGRLRSAVGRLPSFEGRAMVHPGVWDQFNGLVGTRIGQSTGPSALLARLPAATLQALRSRLTRRRAGPS